MDIKFNVKYKFKVNGKEYSSLDEMPADIHDAYDKTIKTRGMEGTNISPGKIVFNGQEYESMDSMPADIRQMYEPIMKTVKSGGVANVEEPGFKLGVSSNRMKDMGMLSSAGVPKPITPKWFLSPAILLIIAIMFALLVVVYLWGGMDNW